MYSPHRNSYLQSRSNGINPRIINRSVQRARNQICIDEYDLDPPFLRLTSEQPCIPIPDVDVTRRPLAFGRWAMPKLRRELHSDDPEVVSQAINSICDLLHDPERGYEAIQLDIPDRLVGLVVNENASIRERVCMTLTVLASLADGRMAIVKNQYMLANLFIVLEDDVSAVRMKAAACVEMLARFWVAADELVTFGFIQLILDNIVEEEAPIAIVHLESLKSLMYSEGKCMALAYDAFEKFLTLIERRDEAVLPGALNCLMILTSSKLGKRLAYKGDILPRLYKLLNCEIPEIYTAAASALMFSTIKTVAKLKASEMEGLPERLITLAQNRHELPTQIFCVKALTNICEHPKIRKLVRENYGCMLDSIPTAHSMELEEHKEILAGIVGWEPHNQ